MGKSATTGWRERVPAAALIRGLLGVIALTALLATEPGKANAASYTLNCASPPASTASNSLEKNGTGSAADDLTINNLANGNTVTFSLIATNGGSRTVTLALTSGSGSGPTPSSHSLTSNNQAASSSFTASATGTAAFSITLANLASGLRGVDWTASCAAPVTINLSPSSPLTAGFEGVAYSNTITASGGTSPYTFAVTSGALPSGA